ncbi:MAG: type I-C CRISPR-associated protein Cas8c/Csd1 [Phycisphaerales bacterium]
MNRERLLQEIVSQLDEFPSQLNLKAQGTFAIGYYHQRKDLFTKKEKSDTEES